jgi:hypothetical protein
MASEPTGYRGHRRLISRWVWNEDYSTGGLSAPEANHSERISDSPIPEARPPEGCRVDVLQAAKRTLDTLHVD